MCPRFSGQLGHAHNHRAYYTNEYLILPFDRNPIKHFDKHFIKYFDKYLIKRRRATCDNTPNNTLIVLVIIFLSVISSI